MKEIIKTVTKGQKEVMAIGSGGNINKVFSLSKRKEGKTAQPGPVERLSPGELKQRNLEERMRLYNLRPDRADVIVPAPAYIYQCHALGWRQ